MKLVSVEQMKAIEKEADGRGLNYAAMMANAGRALAENIKTAYSHLFPKNILGLVGPGNNGGDTLVALTRLANSGWQSTAILTAVRSTDEILIQHFMAEGGRVISLLDDSGYFILDNELVQAGILLDGILGTGARLPLKEDARNLLVHIQAILKDLPRKPHIVAVDCPSGVDCDTGAADPNCLTAERTVCMAAVKAGLMSLPAALLCGDLVVVDIGLPAGLSSWQAAGDRVLTGADIASSLLPRRPEAHKGTFGTAVVAAGSLNFSGAALLAAQSAYLVGAGLVCAAIPQPLHTILAGQLPEATWLPLPHVNGAISQKAAPVLHAGLKNASSLLIGPGFGLADGTLAFLQDLLIAMDSERSKTRTRRQKKKLVSCVVDADGLKLLAQIPNWPALLPEETVLTPHPGEMSILTGLKVDEIQARRIDTARSWAVKWRTTVVLKGAYTVIASPTGRVSVNPLATPALARAGTGDVLAGMVTGFLAQGLKAEEAASAAVYIHGQAALAAMEVAGSSASVLAGDVARMIGTALHDIGW